MAKKTLVTAVAAVLSVLCGLCGCKKEPKPAQHEVSDITTVSLFCSHMDFNYCYSFCVYKEDDVWLFDANCFTNDFTDQTEFESRKILDEDVEVMLDIIEQNGIIVYAENYVKPEDSDYMIMDETKYSFGLRFSDGNSYMTSSAQGKLEDLFYSLAEKYSDAE